MDKLQNNNDDVVVEQQKKDDHHTTCKPHKKLENLDTKQPSREIGKKELLLLAKTNQQAQDANMLLNKFNARLCLLVDTAKKEGKVVYFLSLCACLQNFLLSII